VSHATPLPVQSFFSPPASHGAEISPSGKFVVLIERSGGRDIVDVIDVASREKTIALAPKDGRKVDTVRWKGDDRILAALAPVGAKADPEDEVGGAGRAGETLIAVDRDGSKAVTLGPAAALASKTDPKLRLADSLSRDPAHVLLASANAKGGVSLWKVDVHSGSAEVVRAGEEAHQDFAPGAMVVRYQHHVSEDDFDVLGPVEGADRRAYVAYQPRSAAEGDTTSVRIYDFAHKTLSDPVWKALPYDVSDVVYHEGDKALAGVCYTADAYVCDFKDPKLKADYDKARAFFSNRAGLTPLSMSDDGRYWLFGVKAPTEPGAYYVFDRQTGAMTLVANRHPELTADKLAPMEAIRFRARDGMEIPAYVTRPPGAPAGKPLPLIVMPHGGPEARDSLDFDIWAEFFATRGYLVLQPNFRGSSGYGHKYAEAGYGQWGGKMNDDIADGVQHLIKTGQADKDRICIFGASFGGYAALYGGAKSPDIYKCVASFAGVADLNALVSWEHATKGHEGRYRYAVRSIGDPSKEGSRLQAASPITYASGYRPPVLLIHGSDDESVPVAQSKAMQAALSKAGKDVRLVVFPHEGHTDWSPTDEEAALTEIAAFVESHIEPASGSGTLAAQEPRKGAAALH
jgi:dipeptidyl aminopeptidase/acylaminoacyl peptidase